MPKNKYTNLQKATLLTYILSLSFGVVNCLPIQAQNIQKKTTGAFNITFDPPNESQPRTTKGGASRGSQCNIDSLDGIQSFTPILPTTNYGLTTASHPTLLVNIPSTSARLIFLSLQNENEEEIYQTILPIDDRSGIISLNIPEESPALEIGKIYKWSLALMCDDKLRPDSPVVRGYIERVELESEIANQLEKATPLERAALYGKAGVWYEMIAIVADLRQTQPQNKDLITTWNELLDSVGLEKVAKVKLVE